MTRKRSRAIYCTLEERAAIRARAVAGGKPVSRLILDLAFAEAADRHGSALTAEEMGELLDGFRALVAFVRALKEGTTVGGGSGTGRGGGVPVGAENAEERHGLPAEQVRLSISATDAEWAALHEQARRQGLSMSLHLVRLALPDGVVTGQYADPLPALSGLEQREVLDAVRHMRSLLSGAESPGSALPGMRERFATLFGVGALGLAGSGHGEAIRSAPEPGERPRRSPPAAPVAAENPEGSGEDDAGTTPDPKRPQQGALF